MKRVILASSSPRRKEILERLNIKFEIMASDIDEEVYNDLSPEDLVQKLSLEKAKYIFDKIEENTNDICVIGCDTIVALDGQILGKPKHKQDAFKMLRKLNNKKHLVLTGLTVVGLKDGNHFKETICSSSEVCFGDFKRDEILAYVDTLEPMDKAGAYGIQGAGSFLVSHINGDFYSIMGLPINQLYNIMKKYEFFDL